MSEQVPAAGYPRAGEPSTAEPPRAGPPPAEVSATMPVPQQPMPQQPAPMPMLNPPPMPTGTPQVTVSAGTAFKVGFFGFLGAFTASLIISGLLACVIGVLGIALADWVYRTF